MSDDELARQCAQEWEPGETGPPIWLRAGLLVVVVALVAGAVGCYRLMARGGTAL